MKFIIMTKEFYLTHTRRDLTWVIVTVRCASRYNKELWGKILHIIPKKWLWRFVQICTQCNLYFFYFCSCFLQISLLVTLSPTCKLLFKILNVVCSRTLCCTTAPIRLITITNGAYRHFTRWWWCSWVVNMINNSVQSCFFKNF